MLPTLIHSLFSAQRQRPRVDQRLHINQAVRDILIQPDREDPVLRAANLRRIRLAEESLNAFTENPALFFQRIEQRMAEQLARVPAAPGLGHD